MPGPQFLIIPEDVALRVIPFGEKPVGQANRFDRLTVVNGSDLDACLPLKLPENGFRVNLVLRSVDDDPAFDSGGIDDRRTGMDGEKHTSSGQPSSQR